MIIRSSQFAFRCVAAAIASLALVGTASSQSPVPSAADTGWRFQVTPYLWMAGLDGHIKPFQAGPTAHLDRAFSDLLKDLDAAFFLTGSARQGKLVLYGDLNYVSTSDDGRLPNGGPIRATVRQTSLTLLGGYNHQFNPRSSLDLMGGLRLWDIRAKVSIPGVIATQSKPSFADPILATRWRHDFAPQWSSVLYLDAGGFGAGSRFTWQAQGSINYQWKKNLYLSAGYRHLYVDYRNNGKHLDFSQGGPMLGATFRF
ncbi:MAG: hypothetical protein M0Q54_08110 [Pigmentiphaga sp.]|nr:hypothetical protein [Pigmentiphaga sp.]